MKRGFTLLELMVASLLLAMLVTILTMIFNQSSVAWTTGVASVQDLGDAREQISLIGFASENTLATDGPQAGLQVVSVWNSDGKGLNSEGRAVAPNKKGLERLKGGSLPRLVDPQPNDSTIDIEVSGGRGNSLNNYIVGVTSWGPDGKTGGDYSWDDITTMPEED